VGKTEDFVRLVKERFLEVKVIYDLGAFDFAQSLELAEAFPEAVVYAFEPVPRNLFDHPRVTALKLAVSDVSYEGFFYASVGDNPECGSLLKPNGAWPSPMPVEEVQTQVTRLDRLIDDGRINPPDIIWMDVQGNEPAALQGLGEYLKGVAAVWSEVAYKLYYEGQMLVGEFDAFMLANGFEAALESSEVPEWFGDKAYFRK
jgi:FkbM family methyltransferase